MAASDYAILDADDRIAELQRRLSITEQNAREWQDRYRRVKKYGGTSPDALVFELPPEIVIDLNREAIMRRVNRDQLARRLVEHIVRDKLFAAVLDQ